MNDNLYTTIYNNVRCYSPLSQVFFSRLIRHRLTLLDAISITSFSLSILATLIVGESFNLVVSINNSIESSIFSLLATSKILIKKNRDKNLDTNEIISL